MKAKLTPQQKKQYSYRKDCRYSYGESNKGSRKAVPRRKRIVNKAYRGKVKTTEIKNKPLEKLEGDEIQTEIQLIQKPLWSKDSDKPLKDHIKSKQLWRVMRYGRKPKSRNKAAREGYIEGYGQTDMNTVDHEGILKSKRQNQRMQATSVRSRPDP